MEDWRNSQKIRPHHKEAIEHLIKQLQGCSEYQAIIISGSVAKGLAREDSDIDCYLVVSEEQFAERKRRDQLFFYAEEGCSYSGGYYDGKIITYTFLKAAAELGSEPTRASFEGAFVVFSRIPQLSELVESIPVYPEASRDRNFKDFYAQVLLYGEYFATRAIESGNVYLLSYAVSQIALFSGRLLLAYNRALFPCHKSMPALLQKLVSKPDSYMELQDAMLQQPNRKTIDAFMTCVRDFHDWGISFHEAVSRFIVNNEWNWIDQAPPLSDR